MKTNANAETKKIILIGGDKGGVGKSTLARAAANYLEHTGRPFLAYDGDDTNPTFTRFHPGAARIHTKSVKGFEPLINNIEAEHQIQLVDLGAGTSIVLGQFAEQTGLVEVAAAMGVKLVFLFALAPGVDSVGLLKILAERYERGLHYVVARCNAIPGSWDLWEGSKIRKRILEELNGAEIDIPALDAETYSLVDRHGLTWPKAAEDRRIPLACRSYVHRWLVRVYGEFERIKLGSVQ